MRNTNDFLSNLQANHHTIEGKTEDYDSFPFYSNFICFQFTNEPLNHSAP